MADIQINELLEATSAADADWLAIDNGTATKKISVENFNATGAASAAASAAAAAQSASDASDAKTAAVAAKDDTQALITSASTIVSDAQTYANNASTSAGTASTAANTATAQAAIATNQANLAAGYASNVDTWAKTAKSWAVGGTGTRSGEDTDNSKYYSQQAHDSEINAAASESNASSSESNAAASEGIASAAASSAEADALKAEGYAVGSQDGTPVVSGTYYQNNAKYYKEQAYTSETNAASSEYNAGLSETAAAASESAAKDSEEDSEAWAWGKIDGVDVPATHPAYHNNAKYWADVASGGVSGVASFNGRSGNVVPAIGDYAANIVEFDNTSSGLQSTTTQDAIEEVQDNVDDVASDLSTLDGSLKPVAKSGAYNDLTGKPTLGSAAAKNSTNAVSPGSTDLVESGAVYDVADGLYNSITGNATAIAKAYKKDDTTDTAIASDDYVPFYDTSAQTMKKITKANLDADKQDATDNNLATTNKTVVGAINEVNTNLGSKANTTDVNNKHKVTRLSVSTSGWTSNTTSQSGTTLSKKSVALNHVYVESPSVDIGASGVLPTAAQQEAYNLLQYVTCDSAIPCLYLYASDIPTTAFYINVEGVD